MEHHSKNPDDLLYPRGLVHLSEDGYDATTRQPVRVDACAEIRRLRQRVAELGEIIASLQEQARDEEEEGHVHS